MNISVCITVLNEEESIGTLLEFLLNQSKKPDEIVVVDGGSKDKTVEIIKHYQKKYKKIRLLTEKCSRSRGRNLGVEVAKNEIIAMIDAGCVPKNNWLENITKPFLNKETMVVAGFYEMKYQNEFEKAERVFLGVLPNKFNVKFLPSTRSIAFKKEAFERVGGFPEKLNGAAEDTLFNYNLLKSSVKIVRVKSAVVEWGMPKDFQEFFWKVFNYAKGDAKTKIIYFPTKGLMSHNIKVIFIYLRYILGVFLLISSILNPILFPILIILILAYLLWSYRKGGMWGIILQFISDFAVIAGFLNGIVGKNN